MTTKKKRVRVRTYRHGLGDCHLVSFTKPDGDLFHVLIDCGVVDLTPDPETLMTGVARDIAKETRRGDTSVLDLVVATHQHTDHLSGFQQARSEFAAMVFKRLWLAWTEDRANPQGQKVKEELGKALAAVKAAATALEKNANAVAAERIRGVLEFVGPLGVAGAETQAILDKLQDRPETEIAYHSPGTAFLLPEVPNVRVYVLGPPRDPSWLRICNPRKSKKEGYEHSPAVDALGLVMALAADSGERERGQPFADASRRRPADALRDPFFRTHYAAPDVRWRRIDATWLEQAEELALALDSYTNNTSLALAFEFVDTGEVLLFPGDAQVGSWLSWHELTWKVAGADGIVRDVTITNLLERTVFYKASHHASHNGTLSTKGLELMTNRDLVAFVPVDRAMAKRKRWDRTLPWQPLLDRLAQVTRGRLVLTDQAEVPPSAAKLKQLTTAERARFKDQVTVTREWAQYSV